MKDNDSTVGKHLNVKLRRSDSVIYTLLECRGRIFRGLRRKAPMRHYHRSPVIRIEHPLDLFISLRTRNEYAFGATSID